MKKFTTVVEKNNKWKTLDCQKIITMKVKKYKPDKKQAKPGLDKKNFEVK